MAFSASTPSLPGFQSRHRDPYGHILTALFSRLEAATSRLEDIATSTHGLDHADRSVGAPASSTSKAAPIAAPTSAAAAPVPTSTAKEAAPSPVADDFPAVVVEFDTIIKDDLAPFEKISSGFGGIVAEQVFLPLQPRGNTTLRAISKLHVQQLT